MNKITADELTAGQTFRYGSHEYTVTRTTVITDGNIRVWFEGSLLPMDFYADSPVELLRDANQLSDEDLQFCQNQATRFSNELRNLWRNGPADHRIEFEDKGQRRVSEYTTEKGFLKALIRMYSAPHRFAVIHVD